MASVNESAKTGVTLSLSNNSEKDTILQALYASGEFEIIEANGIITIYSKKTPRKQCYFFSRTSYARKKSIRRYLAFKPKKKVSILERVAKSQNITLAPSDSWGAFCSGLFSKQTF